MGLRNLFSGRSFSYIISSLKKIFKLDILIEKNNTKYSYKKSGNFISSRGLTMSEVIIASAIFGIIAFGFIQTSLLSRQMSLANVKRTQANLVAFSYFEQILGNFHPHQLRTTQANINLQSLDTPWNASTVSLNYNLPVSNNDGFDDFAILSIQNDDDLRVEFNLQVNNSPLYEDYSGQNRTEINPPIGFQSIDLTYRWKNSSVTSEGWSEDRLYSIRPLILDESN